MAPRAVGGVGVLVVSAVARSWRSQLPSPRRACGGPKLTRARAPPPSPRLQSPFKSGSGFIKKATDPSSPPLHREPWLMPAAKGDDPAPCQPQLLKCECPPCSRAGPQGKTQPQPRASLRWSPLRPEGTLSPGFEEDSKVSVYFRLRIQARFRARLLRLPFQP